MIAGLVVMANLVAESGGNKGQLSHLIEAICRDFRQHDEAELKKLVEWQKQGKTRSHAAMFPNTCRSVGQLMQEQWRTISTP